MSEIACGEGCAAKAERRVLRSLRRFALSLGVATG